MAEEKKKIMIHTASGDHVVDMSDKKPKPKFGVLPVSDYVAAVADPDAQPQAGSVGAVVAALVIYCHRENIHRLLHGTEHKFRWHVNPINPDESDSK